MESPKFIFVTGGVCSSLGKGIIAASTAAILKSSGVKVAIMKLDPYLNVDPGTMSPFQHGEVFVLDDGSETDLDLGHYERFISTPLSGVCTVTTGQIYSEVLEEERRGKYLGGTIQVVPHITGKILEKIELAAKKMEVEVLVVEIGGTVGDIEGEPFLEVVRQMKRKYGKDLISMHATLLPYLMASGELKTKPTQLSMRELRRLGVQPDIIFCRSDIKIPKKILKKVSYFCDVPPEAVLPAETIKSIYEVPLRFERSGLSQILNQMWGMKMKPKLKTWEEGVNKILRTQKTIKIAIAGKYNELDDAYLSVIEAIKSAGYHHDRKAEIVWLDTEEVCQNPHLLEEIKSVQGVVVPGGFGNRGIEGKIMVAEFCRENKKPYLGLCLGSQIMAIEFARNVLKISGATSEEFDESGKNKKNHVVHFIPGQEKIRKKGATMRLGRYDCDIIKGTRAAQVYKKNQVSERHRHRYEFNNSFLSHFEGSDFIISGKHPKSGLVEIVEIKNHPFMMGSQFHPELTSHPFLPHPLFREFLAACVDEE